MFLEARNLAYSVRNGFVNSKPAQLLPLPPPPPIGDGYLAGCRSPPWAFARKGLPRGGAFGKLVKQRIIQQYFVETQVCFINHRRD